LCCASVDGLVEQRLVGHHLAAAAAGVGTDDDRGVASSMRLARLTLAKPPNTTECSAPMRAQASIAKAASGIIGM
jgi:hypothetical protein